MSLQTVVDSYIARGERLWWWDDVRAYGSLFGRSDTPTGLSTSGGYDTAYAHDLFRQLRADMSAGRANVISGAGHGFLRDGTTVIDPPPASSAVSAISAVIEAITGSAPPTPAASAAPATAPATPSSGSPAGSSPGSVSLAGMFASPTAKIALGALAGYLLGGRSPLLPTALGAGAGWWLGRAHS